MRPERIIGDCELNAASHQVLGAIAYAAANEGTAWVMVPHSALQKMTGRAKNTIRRALLQLESRGYLLISVVREPGTLREAHQYLVVDDEAQNE